MFSETFKFLVEELNLFFSLKLGATTDARVVLGNAAKALDSDSTGTNTLANKAILSLISLEEDRIAKHQENAFKTSSGVSYKNPPVHINLYALFSVNRTDYGDSLKWLALIVQFFQLNNVFTPTSNPNLDSKIQKLIVDLFTLNFEQINQIWSVLGGKYMPSALYKIRQVSIDEDALKSQGPLIQKLDVAGKLILSV
ncbi:MAG: hypothetical protein NVS1B13_26120 [Flavisolibacter sp.]